MNERLLDRISLTLPTASPYRGVASLVLGGVGGRLDLAYEQTDDLQLGILSALGAAAGDSVTIEIEIADETVQVSVGPLADGTADDRALLNVLAKLVDAVDDTRREGREWLVLSLSRRPERL
ncbi:MAG: hypothetical protein R6W48_09175 [Gaiellaceae bacterium]